MKKMPIRACASNLRVGKIGASGCRHDPVDVGKIGGDVAQGKVAQHSLFPDCQNDIFGKDFIKYKIVYICNTFAILVYA